MGNGKRMETIRFRDRESQSQIKVNRLRFVIGVNITGWSENLENLSLF